MSPPPRAARARAGIGVARAAAVSGARAENFDAYLAERLAPLRPLLSFARSPQAWPPGRKVTATYSWWRDPSVVLGGRAESGRLGRGGTPVRVGRRPPLSPPPWRAPAGSEGWLLASASVRFRLRALVQ